MVNLKLCEYMGKLKCSACRERKWDNFFCFFTESTYSFFQVCHEKRRKYSRTFHVVPRKTCYYFRQSWQRQAIVGIHSHTTKLKPRKYKRLPNETAGNPVIVLKKSFTTEPVFCGGREVSLRWIWSKIY